ncbi:MAG: hypothetical protein ACRC4L_01120 [Mycoplasma sp.]
MKITIIGAGSSYTPELMEGIINNLQHLPIKELCLHDVELGKEKLEIITSLTKRMFDKVGYSLNITKTLNQIEAITDADFVICQLRVGGLDTRIIDEKTPIKYDMLGQETNGFGGMFKALRTIPVILEIVENVKKYSKKDAWIINFSNPSGIVTEAVHRHTDFKNFVGVCNCSIHSEMVIAQYLECKREDFLVEWIGLNHLGFGTKLTKDGKDLTKEVVSAFVNPEYTEKFTMRNVPPIQYEPTYIKAVNLIPSAYYRYFIKYNEMIKEEVLSAKENNSRSEFVKTVEKKLFEKYSDPNLNVKPVELEQRGGAYYSKVAIEVLVGLAGGPEIIHTVNYPNDGTVMNYPKGQVLEISSKISKSKVEQLPSIKEIPSPITGLISYVKNYELQVIKAAMSGNYNDGLIACNISPFCRDDILNKIIYDEMLELHKQYLPLFFGNK